MSLSHYQSISNRITKRRFQIQNQILMSKSKETNKPNEPFAFETCHGSLCDWGVNAVISGSNDDVVHLWLLFCLTCIWEAIWSFGYSLFSVISTLVLCVTVRFVVNSSVVHSFDLKVAFISAYTTPKKLAFSTMNFSFFRGTLTIYWLVTLSFRKIFCLTLCVLLDKTTLFFLSLFKGEKACDLIISLC